MKKETKTAVQQFDRSNVKTIHQEFTELARQFAAERGFEYMTSRCGYSDAEFNIKVHFAAKTQAKPCNDAELIRGGLCERGALVMHHGRQVKILESRQTRYVFEYLDEPGKQWVNKFQVFQPTPIEAKA